MNTVERLLDSGPPRLNAHLRLLKKAWQRDRLLRIMRRLVGAGDVVVDAGANRGVYTILLAHRVGRHGRVHAVEPFPDNVRMLRAATARRPQVLVHGAALSDHSGVASLFVPLQDGRPIHALATLEQPRGTEAVEFVETQVDVRALDDLVGQDASRVSFIKCDVEGHEQTLLEGASSIIAQARPHVLVEIEQRHLEHDMRHTLRLVEGWGYQGYAVFPEGLRPLSEFDVDRDQRAYLSDGFVPYSMPRGYVGDFLFVRPGTDVTGLIG